MTRAGDVRLAGELGADAVGFIFAEGSPRRIHAREARLLRNALAPLVDAVAVFSDNPAGEVRNVVEQVRASLLQVHGDEADAFRSEERCGGKEGVHKVRSGWDAEN